jgi:hypothetical protein
MRGGSSYDITVNGTNYNTLQSEFTLSLKDKINTVLVKTDKDCQGKYEETFLLKNLIQVYPNPVTNQKVNVVLNASSSKSGIVALYTLDGSQVLLQYFDKNKREIALQLPNIPAGTYILMVTQGSKVASKKIIVK